MSPGMSSMTVCLCPSSTQGYASNHHPVIVTCGLRDASDSARFHDGRIVWLDNFGTDEGDWIYRDIGNYPGINCVKGEMSSVALQVFLTNSILSWTFHEHVFSAAGGFREDFRTRTQNAHTDLYSTFRCL